MASKTEHIQIRVTPREKAELKRRAREAGQDLSTYVLSSALPPAQQRFGEAVSALAREATPQFALAELNDVLSALSPHEFATAVARRPEAMDVLSPVSRAYVAAMVEVAAQRLDAAPPEWTAGVAGPDEPYFAVPLESLRPHLLRAAPVPFKRRNLFVDATVGDRV